VVKVCNNSSQGAEALLTHTIKVQFPDLHEQFQNVKALTIMASKLGEVLDIETPDSYIKRPAGPMVTVKVRDITKLAGYIRIPSMAEGALAMDTVSQKIVYSSFPNQCRKCHRFRHQAQTCSTVKGKILEGPPPFYTHPLTNPNGQPSPHSLPQVGSRKKKKNLVESPSSPTVRE
jgi:hypothetical protein